jgi:dinuclear metal center YbgI/SA1388 family protein
MLTVAAVVDYLEQLGPLHLAAEWDNVGLLLGERGGPAERIMTCLTVTPESAGEAIADRAQLIVTHHPILFRAVKRLTDATPEGAMLLALARAGIAVYSPHTAFDNAADGINATLVTCLGLKNVGSLRRREEKPRYKIVVFVPDQDLTRVSDALFAAGAGHIGNYRECSFRLAGTGTFFGSETSNPTIGQKGRREEVAEWRLEVVCPGQQVDAVIRALRQAHSYEEPAYDVYPLRPAPASLGEGRVGSLEEPLGLEALAHVVKTTLRAGAVQMVGDPGRAVQRVAIACGAGGEFLPDAIKAHADAFLTGEARFHDYLAARAAGLALLLPGHYATERMGVEGLAARMRGQWPTAEIWASRKEVDPVNWA